MARHQGRLRKLNAFKVNKLFEGIDSGGFVGYGSLARDLNLNISRRCANDYALTV